MPKSNSSDTANSLRSAVSECTPFVKGSLVVNRRRCGNPKCRCAEGKLHESLAITYKQKGRSVLLHVPSALEHEATSMIRNYHRIKILLGQLSDMEVTSFRRNVSRLRVARAKSRKEAK
jgi:hypothetical protein